MLKRIVHAGLFVDFVRRKRNLVIFVVRYTMTTEAPYVGLKRGGSKILSNQPSLVARTVERSVDVPDSEGARARSPTSLNLVRS
jgi:hypothetical protein